LTKKTQSLSDYITAKHAAQILSLKHGRIIKPSYVHKLKKVRCVKLDATSKLYHKADIEAVTIRQRTTKKSYLGNSR